MIGVFDSGSGGLTVLRALRVRMPRADFVYFGDTEHAPYGNKSMREISELVAMSLLRLRAAGATSIVNACNTASVAIHDALMDLLRINVFTIVGMVEPTVEALAARGGRAVIFCTRATADSGVYQEECKKRGVEAEVIALSALAGLIEKGAGKEEMKAAVREGIQSISPGNKPFAAPHPRPLPGMGEWVAAKPSLNSSSSPIPGRGCPTGQVRGVGITTISLSCTHFPLIKDIFEECVREVGSEAEVFDPAEAVAERVARAFAAEAEGSGAVRFLISAPSLVFEREVAALFPNEKHAIELSGSIYWALKAR